MKAIFNAKVNLTVSNPQVDPTQFDVTFTITDAEGAFSGFDVLANDIIYLDTSGFELGTVSRYQVLSVTSASFSEVEAMVQFIDNNDSPVDPAYAIGIDGYISRPTTNLGLNIAPAPGAQALPDKFFA